MSSTFNIEDYNYQLPEESIARHPLKEREKSKLLLWKKGNISHHIFEQSPSHLLSNSLLVFNDTKVIAARLLFKKSTGAQVEIFLLHPEQPSRDISESMALTKSCVWLCMIGNKKKWKEGELILHVGSNILKASFHNREQNLIRFEWTGDITFSEIINKVGDTPLPPYLKRKPIDEDSERYQTVYSKNNGAVAAPTAGLHFTKDILKQIEAKQIGLEYLTLHVSAGTFKPVETTDFRNHEMHCEQIILKKKSIKNLHRNSNNLIAVGTTSLRILESLFWFGVLLKNNPAADFFISKKLSYENELQHDISFGKSLDYVIKYIDLNNLSELHGETEIYIYPGYKIRSAHGLFTNFHLPKSTLLLLISAFTDEKWKEIYDEALANDYRFLSYGDSSLLLR